MLDAIRRQTENAVGAGTHLGVQPASTHYDERSLAMDRKQIGLWCIASHPQGWAAWREGKAESIGTYDAARTMEYLESVTGKKYLPPVGVGAN